MTAIKIIRQSGGAQLWLESAAVGCDELKPALDIARVSLEEIVSIRGIDSTLELKAGDFLPAVRTIRGEVALISSPQVASGERCRWSPMPQLETVGSLVSVEGLITFERLKEISGAVHISGGVQMPALRFVHGMLFYEYSENPLPNLIAIGGDLLAPQVFPADAMKELRFVGGSIEFIARKELPHCQSNMGKRAAIQAGKASLYRSGLIEAISRRVSLACEGQIDSPEAETDQTYPGLSL